MAVWTLDPAHTSASFSARHMMVTTVRGRCDIANGVLEFDPEHPENARVEAEIDAASLSSGVADRDNHLRSADFLDVANYPTLTFKSTKVEVTGPNTANVTGDLTIRDVTRPLTMKVEYIGETSGFGGEKRIGFAATAKIDRFDWGLTWNVALEAGGLVVGKEIKLELDAEAILVTETATA